LRLKRSKVKKDDGILQYTSENAIIAKVSWRFFPFKKKIAMSHKN
jgi:hypothetical protein